MKQEIGVGDVVRLKSGSPQMTVVAISNNYATVSWYDENLRRETLLLLETLKVVEPDGK